MLNFKLKPTNANIIFMLLLVVAIAVIGPFLFIWALNTLFNLNIEYSLTTWVAVIILNAFLNTAVRNTK